MAKLLIIDMEGCGLDFAFRCQIAGHEVRLYYAPMKFCNTGRGLISRVADWRAHMRWADIILFTSINKYVDELEHYFTEGYPILGTNRAASQLELDREEGQRVLESCGLETIPFTKFSKIEDAIKYVLASGPDARFVSKPCGNGGTAMSYVSKSAKDMLFMLGRWGRDNKLKADFIIQKFVGGIEMGVGGWFGPHGFNGVWEENFEHKKLMPGDKGPNTGEMGTAMKYVESSALAEATLAKCAAVLSALKFVGNVDLNVMIDDKGTIWPLEWTMRLGWPAFYIQNSLHKGDPLTWMIDLIHGKDTLSVRSDHAIGVVVAIPEFPYSHLTGKDIEGYPIYGLNADNFPDIHINEVMAGTAPDDTGKLIDLLVSSGDNLCTVVGRGPTVKKAIERAYANYDEIEIPNSPLLRNDIGQRLTKQLPELQKLGFAEDWTL